MGNLTDRLQHVLVKLDAIPGSYLAGIAKQSKSRVLGDTLHLTLDPVLNVYYIRFCPDALVRSQLEYIIYPMVRSLNSGVQRTSIIPTIADEGFVSGLELAAESICNGYKSQNPAG